MCQKCIVKDLNDMPYIINNATLVIVSSLKHKPLAPLYWPLVLTSYYISYENKKSE